MSHHHHELSELDLYEGDQGKLYSGVLSHHEGGINSEESKKKIKKIWKVTAILSIVTILEVGVGLWAFNGHFHNYGLITYFLILTIFKAYFIVKVFMHLGDEKNDFVALILSPLVLLLWLIIALLIEGDYALMMNSTFAETIKDLLP